LGDESHKIVARPVFWEDPSEEVTLVGLATALLRHRRLIASLPLVGLVLFAAVAFVLPRPYTATTSFLPEGATDQSAGIADLAAQFGFDFSVPQDEQSPQFYAHLLQTHDLLGKTVETRYDFATGLDEDADRKAGDLVELYGLRWGSRAEKVDEAIERLSEDLRVRVGDESGVVSMEVTMPWAELAREVSARMLDLVSEYNLQTRMSRASQERQFIEGRLREVEADLTAAEDSLEEFLRRNRRYDQSPDLRFTYDRLYRRVQLQQQVYASLAESYENSKIEEVRDTPVFTIVEPPTAPARADSRSVIGWGLGGLSLGLVLALILTFLREFAKRAEESSPDDFRQYVELRREAETEVRSLIARVSRLGRRARP
jgi:uncharacterized protein involved in exopolysaccharide biosynthesis